MNSLIKPASEPMSYGKNNETKAIVNFIQQTGNQVDKCGLIMNPEYLFLGSSSDGNVCNYGITIVVIKVKFPVTARNMTEFEDTNAFTDLCLEYSDLVMKHDHMFYHQVQGNIILCS